MEIKTAVVDLGLLFSVSPFFLTWSSICMTPMGLARRKDMGTTGSCWGEQEGGGEPF